MTADCTELIPAFDSTPKWRRKDLPSWGKTTRFGKKPAQKLKQKSKHRHVLAERDVQYAECEWSTVDSPARTHRILHDRHPSSPARQPMGPPREQMPGFTRVRCDVSLRPPASTRDVHCPGDRLSSHSAVLDAEFHKRPHPVGGYPLHLGAALAIAETSVRVPGSALPRPRSPVVPSLKAYELAPA